MTRSVRMKRLAYQLATICLATLASGCTPPATVPNAPPPNNQPRMQAGSEPKKLTSQGRASLFASNTAAAADAPIQLQVDVYQLRVPYGTVSRNEAFWKRVDEQAVGVATYDLLFKNGIRVGEAPVTEWDYFRQVMEAHPAVTTSNTLVGAEGKPIELPLRKEVRNQEIFYFDSLNQLEGRSWDQSENVIAMTIQSAPRKADTLRIALCPMVRGMRKQLQYSAMNQELGEITYAAPERMYKLNLCADVPADQFLIIAPSGESTWPTSLGNSFLVTDGVAEKMETVLLIVPKPVRFIETPIQK